MRGAPRCPRGCGERCCQLLTYGGASSPQPLSLQTQGHAKSTPLRGAALLTLVPDLSLWLSGTRLRSRRTEVHHMEIRTLTLFQRLKLWQQLDEITDPELRNQILDAIDPEEQIYFDYLLDSGALDP